MCKSRWEKSDLIPGYKATKDENFERGCRLSIETELERRKLQRDLIMLLKTKGRDKMLSISAECTHRNPHEE